MRSEKFAKHAKRKSIGGAVSYLVDYLVSLPGVDKIDTFWMKSVGFSLHHLVGLLVLHLFERQ